MLFFQPVKKYRGGPEATRAIQARAPALRQYASCVRGAPAPEENDCTALPLPADLMRSRNCSLVAFGQGHTAEAFRPPGPLDELSVVTNPRASALPSRCGEAVNLDALLLTGPR